MMQRMRMPTGAFVYLATSVVTLILKGQKSSFTRLKIAVISAALRLKAGALIVAPPFQDGSLTISPSKSR